MGALQSAALHPESDMRARIPPEMSNYYCHPGKAGGSPLDFSCLSDLKDDPHVCGRSGEIGRVGRKVYGVLATLS